MNFELSLEDYTIILNALHYYKKVDKRGNFDSYDEERINELRDKLAHQLIWKRNLMPDETWTVMNNLEQSFSRISTVEFMLDELQEAVDEQNQMKIVDICYALNSFLPVYTENWDKNFKKAWKEVVV